MLLAALLLSPVVGLAPNDFCSTAFNATDSGTNSGDNTKALMWAQAPDTYNADIWYKYTPSSTGQASLSSATTLDLYANVFYGPSCNNLYPDSGAGEYFSGQVGDGSNCHLDFPVVVGQTVYIAIGSYSAASQGAFTFTITVGANANGAPPASGGTCATAAPVVGGTVTVSNTQGLDPSNLYSGTDVNAAVYAVYTATCTGLAYAKASSANIITGIFSFYDNRCPNIFGNDRNLYQENDVGCNNSIAIPVYNASSYIIAFGSYDFNSYDSLALTVGCVPTTRAAYDICSLAQTVTATFTADTNLAQSDFNNNLCYEAPSGETWMTWNSGTCAGLATLTIGGSTSTAVAVIQGSCSDGTLVHCANANVHTWVTTANTNYQIAIGDNSGSQYTGTIACAPLAANVPTNTLCANAVTVVDGVVQHVTNANALTDPATNLAIGTPYYSSCQELYSSVYYYYSPPCTGTVTLSFGNTSNTLSFALFADKFCTANDQPVYCDSDFTSGAVQWNVQANEGYTFALGSYDSGAACTGTFSFSVSCNGTIPAASSAPSPAPTPAAGSGSTAPSKAGTTIAPSKVATGSTAPSKVGTTLTPSNAPSTTGTKPAASAAGLVGFGAVSFLAVLLL